MAAKAEKRPYSCSRLTFRFGPKAVVKKWPVYNQNRPFSLGTLPKPIIRLRVRVAALVPLSGKVCC